MLTEVLGVVEKANTRPLLIAMTTLSLLVRATGGAILGDPFTWALVVILPLGVMAYVLVIGWIYMIQGMNARLPENDMASWGPIIGSSLLAFCLLLTFSYVSSHPEGLSLSLLGEPDFVYVCTVFLLATETAKIRR